MGENMLIRGIQGPSKCVYYYSSLETSSHLFMECSFFKSVWQVVLQGISHRVQWLNSMIHLFSCWISYCQGSFLTKHIFNKMNSSSQICLLEDFSCS
jgi:hypothetical protein